MGDLLFGGTGTTGHLFSYDPATGTSTDLGEAVPGQTEITSFVIAPDGFVYGGTGVVGGTAHLFRFHPDTLWPPEDLGEPVEYSATVAGLTLGAGGLLYGAAGEVRVLFGYDIGKDAFFELGEVPGAYQLTCLTYGPDGKLYGGDYPGGHLWYYDLESGDSGLVGQPVPGEYQIYTVVAGPDGSIWGGTGWGLGHLFRYDPASGSFESFGAPIWRDTRLYSLMLAGDGYLYGGTGSRYGRLFRVHALDRPYATPGTAVSISIAPALQHKTYVPGTSEVWALATASDGRLYASGYSGGGVPKLTRWDPAVGGLMEVLGNVPGAPAIVYALLQGPQGKIYGGGGSWDTAPNLFRYDPVWGEFGYLSPGLVQEGYVNALALCPDGLVYGGTGGAGADSLGQVFSYDPAPPGAFTYYGQAVDGETSVEALVCAPDGTLYGGTYPDGHLFRLVPGQGFSDLGQPVAGQEILSALAWATDGRLYGGTTGDGHFFVYEPSGGSVLDLGAPVPADTEIENLAATADGLVWGTTGATEGHLFSYDPATGFLADLGQAYFLERSAYGLAPSQDGQAVYVGTGYNYGELVGYERGYRFAWQNLAYYASTPTGTALAVDVLDTAGTVLLSDLPPEASLEAIPASAVPAIHLRARLSSAEPYSSPALLEWSVEWTVDPILAVTPPSLLFRAPLGGPEPQPQTLALTNAGGGMLDWSLSGVPEWLEVDPESGTAPSLLIITPQAQGLPAGDYTATLLFEGGPDCANCPVEVPVTLVVRWQALLPLVTKP